MAEFTRTELDLMEHALDVLLDAYSEEPEEFDDAMDVIESALRKVHELKKMLNKN